MILSGAGLIEGSEQKKIQVHQTEQTDAVDVTSTGVYGTEDYAVTAVKVYVEEKPYTKENDENFMYVMLLKEGEVVTEPYIPESISATPVENKTSKHYGKYEVTLKDTDDLVKFYKGCVVLVDYYTEKGKGASQIEITPDKFGGNYYLEASTLFRDTNGVDMPAEFIIPNCKVQSSFNFAMSASGDPSTFTFTLDAFPDYTRFNKTKKVLAAIQIIEEVSEVTEQGRDRTKEKAARSVFFEPDEINIED